MRASLARWTVAVTVGLLLTALLSGWGRPARPAAASEQPDAARAVHAVTEGRPGAAAQLPADFADVMGYTPAAGLPGGPGAAAATAPAGPARADGGCSSPFGDYLFGPACRQHDLGYDLLRYADRKGEPLGAWARHAIDGRFAATVRAERDGSLRGLAAGALYTSAVRFNSFRQGWGVPVIEPVSRIAAPAVAGLLGALLIGSARLRRRTAAVTAPARALAGRVLLPRAGRTAVTAAALGLTLQPGMLSIPLWARAVVGGAVVLQTYLLGSLAGRAWRSLRRRPADPWIGRALLAGAAAVLTVSALGAQQGALGVARTAGAAPGTVRDQGLAIGASIAAGALALALLHALFVRVPRAVARGLRRSPGRRLAALLIAPALVLTGSASAAAAPASAGIGVHGQRFVSAGAAGAAGPGADPVRVYVGRGQAPTAAGRAARAVAELDAAGGFDRRVLLVVVPTGSGWVNPEAVSTVERLAGGDVASVAVQYAASPSWVAYLRGGEGVQEQVRALMSAVDARVEARPAGDRPRVLLYGESLGAWGGITAYPEQRDLAAVADAALWTGVPAGAPEVAPGGPARTLSHADDPVPAWSPRLLVEPSEKWPGRWLPGLTFWQATGDVIVSTAAPAGHGHHYGPELAPVFGELIGR